MLPSLDGRAAALPAARPSHAARRAARQAVPDRTYRRWRLRQGLREQLAWARGCWQPGMAAVAARWQAELEARFPEERGRPAPVNPMCRTCGEVHQL